jgi:hypothetical protein
MVPSSVMSVTVSVSLGLVGDGMPVLSMVVGDPAAW